MVKHGFSRRRFVLAGLLAAPVLAGVSSRFIEPKWVAVRKVRLPGWNLRSQHRFVHFTDIHHKGDREYLLSVVRKINALSPECAFFTGDLIEEVAYLSEALEILRGIKCPVYGVPGNHDYWSKASFAEIAASLKQPGGAWLLDADVVLPGGEICLMGADGARLRKRPVGPAPGMRTILLMHYPAWAKQLTGEKFDLILAGHSHGGQVRLPFYGALFVPFGVDEYDLGMFHTQAGPLYVNPGIGWFPVPIRFNCRPEITVFEV